MLEALGAAGWTAGRKIATGDWTQQLAAAGFELNRNTERSAALTDFLHIYNYHRCHTALGGQPPISRVNNPAGQYT